MARPQHLHSDLKGIPGACEEDTPVKPQKGPEEMERRDMYMYIKLQLREEEGKLS